MAYPPFAIQLKREHSRLWRAVLFQLLKLGGSQQDAEDVFQHCLLALLEAQNRYDPTYPLWPWLKCFVFSSVSQWLKYQKRAPDALSSDEDKELPDPKSLAWEPHLELQLLLGSQKRPGPLAKCVKRLPPLQRRILEHSFGVVLELDKPRHVTLLSSQALATLLNAFDDDHEWSASRVAVQRCRAITSLRECLKSSESEAAPQPLNVQVHPMPKDRKNPSPEKVPHSAGHPAPFHLLLTVSTLREARTLSPRQEVIHEHLEQCEQCQKTLRELQELEGQLQQLGTWQKQQNHIDPDFSQKQATSTPQLPEHERWMALLQQVPVPRQPDASRPVLMLIPRDVPATRLLEREAQPVEPERHLDPLPPHTEAQEPMPASSVQTPWRAYAWAALAATLLLSLPLKPWNWGEKTADSDAAGTPEPSAHGLSGLTMRGSEEHLAPLSPLFLTIQPLDGSPAYDQELQPSPRGWYGEVPVRALIALFIRAPELKTPVLDAQSRDSDMSWYSAGHCEVFAAGGSVISLLSWHEDGLPGQPWVRAGKGLALRSAHPWTELRCGVIRGIEAFEVLLRPLLA